EARTPEGSKTRPLGFAALLGVAAVIALIAPSAGSAANGVCAATATSGTQTTYACNVPTGTIGGYEVRQWYDQVPNPTPPANGWITHMKTDVIDDVTGEQVPISRLMLHHIVFINVNRQDATCAGQGYLG